MNKPLTMISAAAVLTALAGPAYADQHGKTVFLTIASFNGNLGGLTGADEKCQAEADGPASIVPSSTYLAWLVNSAFPAFGSAVSKPPLNQSLAAARISC